MTAAQRYKKQAEDARRAIDAGIAPRATPPAPVKSSGQRKDGSTAANVDQLELVPVPRCNTCGPLQHTIDKWHRETHKCGCPHRTDPFCQAHPAGCDDFTDIRNKKPSYQITELRGKTWADAFGGDAA